MQIPVPLLRSVLRLGDEPEATLRDNFRLLREAVRPEGLDAHLLAFIEPLVTATQAVPPVALVRDYYEALLLHGDSNAQAGLIRLAEIVEAGGPCLDTVTFKYQLDQFEHETLSQGFSALMLQVGAIMGPVGLEQRTKQGVVVHKGPHDARDYLDRGLADLFGQFSRGDLEGNFWADITSVLARAQQRAATATQGLLTGFTTLDMAHGPMQPGDLVLVLGFTGQLKSTVVQNIAYHAAIHQGKHVGLVSLEMSPRALQDALVCLHAHHPQFLAETDSAHPKNKGFAVVITYDKLRLGQLTAREAEVVKLVTDDLATNKTYGKFLYKSPDTDLSIRDIRRWAEAQDDLALLAVDYLALVNPSSGGQSLKESAYANMAIRESKQMAMAFKQGKGVTLISPVQSNREGFKEAEKNGGRYTLRALAWAPEGEKSADLVHAIYRSPTLAGLHQAQMQNLKARDRQLVLDPWVVFADPAIKVVADENPDQPYQRLRRQTQAPIAGV